MPKVVKEVAAMLTARADVDDALVIDYGVPEPILVIVKPCFFCSGPELRDACAAALDEPATRVVVLLATKLPRGEDKFPNLESALSDAAYVFRYEPPVTETEERMVALWNDALERRVTGVRDDFLDLGGDSEAAVRIIAIIEQEFSVEIDLTDFFDAPTVREIAALVDACAIPDKHL